jgi:hypothetical protein
VHRLADVEDACFIFAVWAAMFAAEKLASTFGSSLQYGVIRSRNVATQEPTMSPKLKLLPPIDSATNLMVWPRAKSLSISAWPCCVPLE